jgi:hypothetical protein
LKHDPTDYIYEIRDLATQRAIQTFHDSGLYQYQFCNENWLQEENHFYDLTSTTQKHNLLALSHDGTRGVLSTDVSWAPLISLSSDGPPLCKLEGTTRAATFSDDDSLIVSTSDEGVTFRRRIRPEAWWGVAWLPFFWGTLVLSAALVWSVRRDYSSR